MYIHTLETLIYVIYFLCLCIDPFLGIFASIPQFSSSALSFNRSTQPFIYNLLMCIRRRPENSLSLPPSTKLINFQNEGSFFLILSFQQLFYTKLTSIRNISSVCLFALEISWLLSLFCFFQFNRLKLWRSWRGATLLPRPPLSQVRIPLPMPTFLAAVLQNG